jgi:hypothetical protein
MGFGLVIAFTEHSKLVITGNCNSFMDLCTLRITVTAAHMKSSMFSLVVAGNGSHQWIFLSFHAHILIGWRLLVYNIGTDCKEHTASSSFSVVVAGPCLAMDWVLLTCLLAIA